MAMVVVIKGVRTIAPEENYPTVIVFRLGLELGLGLGGNFPQGQLS